MVAAPARGYRRRRPPGTLGGRAGRPPPYDREAGSGRPSPSAVTAVTIEGSGSMSEMIDFNTQIIEEFRANEGKIGGQFEGAPLLLLTTTGAKSGRHHTTPVMYLPHGDRLVVFASKAGAPTNPAWYHNLVANPEASVEVGTDNFPVKATVLQGEER